MFLTGDNAFNIDNDNVLLWDYTTVENSFSFCL